MKAGFIRSFDLSSPLRSVYSSFFLYHDLRVSLVLFCILFIGGFVSIDQWNACKSIRVRMITSMAMENMFCFRDRLTLSIWLVRTNYAMSFEQPAYKNSLWERKKKHQLIFDCLNFSWYITPTIAEFPSNHNLRHSKKNILIYHYLILFLGLAVITQFVLGILIGLSLKEKNKTFQENEW